MVQQPSNLLIYYGYLNSFNSAVNFWNNESVAQNIAKYDVCVFGDGVADPTHPDYANTQVIIARLLVIKPDIKIFGYASANQALATFQTKVNQWNTLNVQGIFLDEAGYDYGVTRDQLITKVNYVHGKDKAKLCFVNAWNMDHIIGTANDPGYPNSTFNPTLKKATLNSNDWYLLESFAVNSSAYSGNNGYATQSDVLARGAKAAAHNKTYGIKLAVVGVIDNSSPTGQNLATFNYHTSLAFGVETTGTSDVNYGASSAQVAFWDRPTPKDIGTTCNIVVSTDLNNGNICFRYGSSSKVILDFTAAAQTSSIISW